MSDPAIKLFGKTIQVAPNDDVSHEADCEQSCCDHSNNNNNCLSCSNGSVSATSLFDKNSAAGEGSTDSKLEDGPSSAVLEEQAPCEDKESASLKSSKKKDQSETSKSEDKPLKKPDKLLPCPRCNSNDTKFCYFNNYNANQPRYFCKNCQRYWTAGGTMRNVPVGAGRRKNKHSASNPRYIVIPDTPNGAVYPTLRANAFGLEAPLCESMTSALTIADKSLHNAPNGYPDTSLNSMGKVVNPVTQESSTSGFQGFGPPWPNPWNPPFPFPMPFYAPPPYWNSGAPWMIPPILSADLSSPPCSSPNSPLGKHPREGGTLGSSDKEQHGEETKAKVLTPKILRIDDPSEAAKSSIWTTLGIKHENTSWLNSGVFFRGLQSKGGQKSSAPEASSVLQANPAALSRSLTYQESAE